MFKKVSAYVEKHHMLSAGDTVVAGVSGGADSVCLLLVLSALKKEIPFRLLVVHLNHGIRPQASKDADFVRDLCKRLDVPFFLMENDVEAVAREAGISTEEAGRKARYEAFKEILRKEDELALTKGHAKIAVAHNLNDRAETMLFNLFRGSGLTGLCSIKPVRSDAYKDGASCELTKEIQIIRPLLSVTRKEIEDFLTGHGMSWCMDHTNDEDTYTRNRIRHHILPFAEDNVAAGAVSNMGRAADILSETEDFVKKETQKAYNACVVPYESDNSLASTKKVQTQTSALLVEQMLLQHSFLQKQIILRCLEELTPARKDITHVHVEDVLSLFEKKANREIILPYGIKARREYDKVILEKAAGTKGASETDKEEQNKFLPVTLPDLGGETIEIAISETEVMEFQVMKYEKSLNIPQNQCTKWFDYDKIKKSLTIRTRQTGDFLTFNSAFSRKSIQDYMVEEKIPKHMRDKIPLLAEEEHILWVVGHRISSYYKIDETTKNILQVQIRGGH